MAQQLYLLAILSASVLIKRNRKKRKKWTKSWLGKRQFKGDMILLKDLYAERRDYHNFLRMNEESFIELKTLVSPEIIRKNTVMREAISVEERLAATLRFLATGRSYECLKFSTHISAQALGKIIPETCAAIYNALRDKYMKFPSSQGDWKCVAKDFENKWGFPHCLGALDGKHISIKKPPGSGAFFYNYKAFYSVVLMAIVNAKKEFMYCHVGTNGRVSDGGVIENTDFSDDLKSNALNIPPEEVPQGYSEALPYVFIGDEAFALGENLLKPFSQRDLQLDGRSKLFNSRLCSARQCVENAFGILATRFRIFHTAININLKHIDCVVLACCALHNFLQRKSPSGIDDVILANENLPENTYSRLSATHDRHSGLSGRATREKFVEYFINKRNLQQ